MIFEQRKQRDGLKTMMKSFDSTDNIHSYISGSMSNNRRGDSHQDESGHSHRKANGL